MTQQPSISPGLKLKAFNCLHCKAYAQQSWLVAGEKIFDGFKPFKNVSLAECNHCNEQSIWVKGKLIYPKSIPVSTPNSDLPEDIKADYTEASLIVTDSPRGAAALLLLCIQKLCKHLGEQGENINKDIASLVAKGLSPKIQKSLDVVRVIGNEAVHPGSIDLNDQPDIAMKLFDLVNIIAETMISHPKMIDAIYEELPDQKLNQINKRDNPGK
jgi:hypothetical protein